MWQEWQRERSLPVGDVAGVVDPHELVEALAPPRGQLQPHMEGVLRV